MGRLTGSVNATINFLILGNKYLFVLPNIKLGSYYFNSLIEDYNGVYPFAIAAYNAGPNRVKTWRRVNGDPSKGQLSYINWIEQIRFEETRNYVQRVLENINVYKYILSKEPVKIDSYFN